MYVDWINMRLSAALYEDFSYRYIKARNNILSRIWSDFKRGFDW
jgi:hypothetical protein